MRGTFLSVLGIAALAGSAAAEAGAQAYCEAYARDAASARLTGSALLTGVRTPVSPEQWSADYQEILAGCLAVYATAEPAARPAKKAATKTHGGLVPSSEAWNDYCDRKYASFDRKTGLYHSQSGKMRPCVAGKSIRPVKDSEALR